MEYKFILLPITLGLILPPLVIPWLTIDFLGHHSYLPVNILGEIINHNNSQNDNFLLLDITSTYHDSYFAIVFSMILYLASIFVIIASIIFGKRQKNIILVGGIIGIIATATWIYAVNSFKSHFSQEAASTGGLIAGEWKGKENQIVDHIIMMGSGYYFVFIGGALAVSIYVIDIIHSRKNTQNPRQPATH
jgi:hypothetical protein